MPVSEEVRRRHEQELLARRRAHLEAIRWDRGGYVYCIPQKLLITGEFSFW